MIKKPHKKRLNIKALAIMGIAVLVVGGGVYAYIRHRDQPKPISAPAGVNLAPATPQEKAESQQNKERIVQQQATTPPTTSTKKSVGVVITNASMTSVNAYVTGVFEDGGVCTATFTQGTTTITKTSTGFSNVSYTQCPPITPNLPNTDPWSVTMSYSSATAEGTSQAQTL